MQKQAGKLLSLPLRGPDEQADTRAMKSAIDYVRAFLRRERAKRDSWRDVCADAGIKPSVVSGIVGKRRNARGVSRSGVRLATIDQIAAGFDVPVSAIFSEAVVGSEAVQPAVDGNPTKVVQPDAPPEQERLRVRREEAALCTEAINGTLLDADEIRAFRLALPEIISDWRAHRASGQKAASRRS